MPKTAAELMKANLLGVFGERDDQQRLAVAAEIYADDVRFAEPGGVLIGRAAIAEKAGALLAEAPGFVFAPSGDVRESQDLALLAWTFGPAEGPPVVSGIDIAIIENGVITSLYTLLDEAPTAA